MRITARTHQRKNSQFPAPPGGKRVTIKASTASEQNTMQVVKFLKGGKKRRGKMGKAKKEMFLKNTITYTGNIESGFVIRSCSPAFYER